MKVLAVLCCCLPFVFAMPEKRILFGSIGNLFDFTTLKNDLQLMLDILGADPTEGMCEMECHELIQDGHVLNYGCPFVCHAFQTLIKQFSLVREAKDVKKRLAMDSSPEPVPGEDCLELCESQLTGGQASSYACPALCAKIPSHAYPPTRDVKKRLAMDSSPEPVPGEDCLELCESQLTGGQASSYACPALCAKIPSHAYPPTRDVNKRLAMDSLPEPATLKQDLLNLGSESSMEDCLEACQNLITGGQASSYACPSLCEKLQTIASSVSLPSQANTPTSDKKKRFLFDSITQISLVEKRGLMTLEKCYLLTFLHTYSVNMNSVKDTLQLMLDVLGSDPTEQACENECHSLLSQGHVLDYGCTFLCREFQVLVSSYKLTTPAP